MPLMLQNLSELRKCSCFSASVLSIAHFAVILPIVFNALILVRETALICTKGNVILNVLNKPMLITQTILANHVKSNAKIAWGCPRTALNANLKENMSPFY